VQELEMGIPGSQLFPKFPYTKASLSDIGIVKQSDRARTYFRQPGFEICRNGLIGMKAVDMQEIDAAIRESSVENVPYSGS
jgi:hypothetical protein